MTYSDRTGTRRRRRSARSLLIGPLASVGAGVIAIAFVAYVLWPRWPVAPVSPDAAPLPIMIGGETFNVPPAAIRRAIQRHAGAQARIDLAFLWPSLQPGGPEATPARPRQAPVQSEPEITGSTRPADRLFVTIAVSDGTLPVLERFRTIYPRYTLGDPATGADGLTRHGFRADTPYQGETLVYDAGAPERFLARCSQFSRGPAHGTCLLERQIGDADITIRFPRDWLIGWRNVAAGVDRLIAQLRVGGG